MVKNLKGGSGHKKCKNSTNKQERRKMEYRQKEYNEVYGIITKILGNGRVTTTYIDDITSEPGVQQTTLGIIRNSIRRQKFSVGNIILISLRPYQNDKVDIIYKYNDYEINILRKQKQINEYLLETNSDKDKFNDKTHFYNDDDDDEDTSKKYRNNLSYSEIYNTMMPNSDSESDNEEEINSSDYTKNTQNSSHIDGDTNDIINQL